MRRTAEPFFYGDPATDPNCKAYGCARGRACQRTGDCANGLSCLDGRCTANVIMGPAPSYQTHHTTKQEVMVSKPVPNWPLIIVASGVALLFLILLALVIALAVSRG